MNTRHLSLRHLKYVIWGVIVAIIYVWITDDIFIFILDTIIDTFEPNEDVQKHPLFHGLIYYVSIITGELFKGVSAENTIYYPRTEIGYIPYIAILYNVLEEVSLMVKNVLESLHSVLSTLAGIIGFLGVVYGIWFIWPFFTMTWEGSGYNTEGYMGTLLIYGFIFFIQYVLITAGIQEIPTQLYLWVNKIKKDDWYKQIFTEGKGGSAQWASVETFNGMKYDSYNLNSKNIYLGKSLIDDDPHVRHIGTSDDGHMMTIATTGAGKSVSAIKPNLAMYDGSVIVFDPKGELAKSTSKRRLDGLYQQVHILDPYNESHLVKSGYNPLSEIDINSDRAREMISAISDGCVVVSGNEKDQHWNEWAKALIEGLIAHVLSTYRKEKHNLPFILDLFSGIDGDGFADPEAFDELLLKMMTNPVAGGLAQQAAVRMEKMGDTEKGSIMSSVYRSLKWCGDPAMRKHLTSKSDFKFEQMAHDKKSIYIVLPDGLIASQMRWLRVLFGVGIIALQKGGKPQIPTLLIIDEFAKLGGGIKIISDGFGIFRSYGIKLWTFNQSLQQLMKDYPNRWSAMLGSSTVQLFGIEDIETAEWVSKNLGESLHKKKEKHGKQKIIKESIKPLLTPSEVIDKFSKYKNRQVIFPLGYKPMRLERLAYKDGIKLGSNNISKVSIEGRDLSGCFDDY